MSAYGCGYSPGILGDFFNCGLGELASRYAILRSQSRRVLHYVPTTRRADFLKTYFSSDVGTTEVIVVLHVDAPLFHSRLELVQRSVAAFILLPNMAYQHRRPASRPENFLLILFLPGFKFRFRSICYMMLVANL